MRLEDLGAAVGISGPAVYRHFPNKEAVLVELLVDISEYLLTGGQRVASTEKTPAEVLGDLIDFHLDFALTSPALIEIQDRDLQSLTAAAHRKVRRMQREYVEIWVSVLRRLDPTLEESDARTTAHAAFGLMNSTPFSANRTVSKRSRILLRAMATGALGSEHPSVSAPRGAVRPARSHKISPKSASLARIDAGGPLVERDPQCHSGPLDEQPGGRQGLTTAEFVGDHVRQSAQSSCVEGHRRRAQVCVAHDQPTCAQDTTLDLVRGLDEASRGAGVDRLHAARSTSGGATASSHASISASISRSTARIDSSFVLKCRKNGARGNSRRFRDLVDGGGSDTALLEQVERSEGYLVAGLAAPTLSKVRHVRVHHDHSFSLAPTYQRKSC